uniref:Uncharacterized protein n=1 Tax=Parascaris equorum TaxID=6256 RepID=A0A914REE9_PAREQ
MAKHFVRIILYLGKVEQVTIGRKVIIQKAPNLSMKYWTLFVKRRKHLIVYRVSN